VLILATVQPLSSISLILLGCCTTILPFLPQAHAAKYFLATCCDDRKLWTYDTVTDLFSEVGVIRYVAGNQNLNLNGITVDPTDGTLYGKSASGNFANNGMWGNFLWRIDKATAEATPVAMTPTLPGGYLAANCRGELYMLSGGSGSSSNTGQPIIRLDKTTAQGTVLTGQGFQDITTNGNTDFSLSFDGQDDDILHWTGDQGNIYATFDLGALQSSLVSDINSTMNTRGLTRGCDFDKSIGNGKILYCFVDNVDQMRVFNIDNFDDPMQDIVEGSGINPNSFVTDMAFDWDGTSCLASPPPTATPTAEKDKCPSWAFWCAGKE
jgi:hypothetical protein